MYKCGKQVIDHDRHVLWMFIAVKSVVFLGFWQSIVLDQLAKYDLLPNAQGWSEEDVSMGVQNLLTCFEMLAVCVLHHFVFDSEPYSAVSAAKSFPGAVVHAFSVTDVVQQTAQSTKDARKKFQ